MRRDIEERFWSFVVKGITPNHCWVWTGGKCGGGYGQFRVEERNMMMTHRYSYKLHNGPIPEGMQVCHTCDNKWCVNPNHLWLGTNKDNSKDKVAKGRQAHITGENHYAAKLTWKDIDDIRQRLKQGESCTQLGIEYAIRRDQVWRIGANKLWKEEYRPTPTHS